MSIRRILLSLTTFPDPAPQQCLEGACAMARLLSARLTAQLPQLSSDRDSWPAVMGTFPLDVPRLMDELVVKSESNAAATSQALTQLASEYGIALDLRRSLTTLYGSADPMVDLARLHDLVVLPVPETDGFGRADVQAAIFGGGRPVVLLPSGKGRPTLHALDRIMVAWDYSRAAARALADALPILALAKEVHVIMAFGEKGIETTCTEHELEEFLASHGVKCTFHRPMLEEGTIGKLLAQQAEEVKAQMLVMGAYGHSRLREFVLGGATRAMLADPPLPILLSH